jgi:hypothetical protein
MSNLADKRGVSVFLLKKPIPIKIVYFDLELNYSFKKL